MVDEDHDHNVENVCEKPEIVEEAGQAGNKRKAPDSGKPPKAKRVYPKRADVWRHFIQRLPDSPTANCRYCGQPVGCDTVKTGTSSMKGHIKICKRYIEFNERETQQALGSDNKGNMRVIKYDHELYRQCTNQLVVMNELSFSFVESEGWKRFTMNMLPIYTTFSRKTCSTDISGMYLH